MDRPPLILPFLLASLGACVTPSVPEDAASTSRDAAGVVTDDLGRTDADAMPSPDAPADALGERSVDLPDVTSEATARPDAAGDASGDAVSDAQPDGSTLDDDTRFDRWAAVFRLGGRLDTDADGTDDIVVEVRTDGATVVTALGPRGPRWVRTRRGPTDLTEQSDRDGDGRFDATRTVTATTAAVTTVETEDEDFDGTPDRRTTSVVRGATRASKVEQWLHPRDGGPRTWLLTSAYTNRGSDAACPPFPPPIDPTTEPPPPPADAGVTDAGSSSPDPDSCGGECTGSCFLHGAWNGYVVPNSRPLLGRFRVLDSGPHACSPAEITALTDAMRGLRTQAYARLKPIHTERAALIADGLSNYDVVYGCGRLSCRGGGVIAETEGPEWRLFPDNPGASLTLFNHSDFTEPPAEAVRNVLRQLIVHEWFHAVGKHHPVDDSGQEQRDWLYGCSRYATRFQAGFHLYEGTETDASSARDGAVCATIDNKRRFGIGSTTIVRPFDVAFYELMPGALMELPLCSVDADSEPTGVPTCANMNVWAYCDQTPLRASDRAFFQLDTPVCSLTCPLATPYQPRLCSTTADRALPDLQRVGGCTAIDGALY